MQDRQHTRRDVLRSAAIAGGTLAGGSLAGPLAVAGSPLFTERKTKRVVFIAFAGGVRTKETFGTPANVPNLQAMADEGVLYPRMRTANLGHFGATMSIFTGISEARGIRDNTRGPDPTLFEYLRKDLDLAGSDVWITTSGGAQQTNYAYGLHPEYGPKYGATTLDGDGIFNREFKDMVASYGMPKPMQGGEKQLLDQLRLGIQGGREPGVDPVKEAENLARVEEYILNELTRGTSGISGAGAGDGKALRLARNLLSLFKPKVVSVVLQNADIAHGSFNGYQEVIRRNDAAIGEIWTAVREDPELADSTAFFVLPEFGRNRDLNTRRGLDHGDGSDDLRWVSCMAWGPDFKRGVVNNSEQRVIDVSGTICDMFGAEPKFSKGGKLSGLFG
jgi:hypothetical protein